MKRLTAIRKILCLCIAAVLLLAPAALPSVVLAEEGNTSPLGYSTVATDAAFLSAMNDPAVTTVVLQGNINASAVNWAVIQNGEKIIIGATGNERLALPALVPATGKLTFDRLVLARGAAAGTQIYANSHAFRFGPDIVMAEQFISALFGGGYNVTGLQADLTLEGGAVNAVYLGGNQAVITGNAALSLWPKATVGGVYGIYENSAIRGTKTVTLNGYGAATGYAEQLPAISGATTVRLSASHVKRRDWTGLGAEQFSVSADSVLWLDGSMSPGSRLHGEGAGLIVTSGSVITLPDPATSPGYVTGAWALSMSAGAGDSLTIQNGGTYKNLFTVPDELHLSGENDLLLSRIYLEKIELTALPKTNYFRGNPLETAGGRLLATYGPAALAVKPEIALTNDMVSGFDSSRIGAQTLTVTYGGKTAFYQIWVADPDIARLSLSSLPNKTRYYVGENLSLTGGLVEVRYANGALYRVPFSDAAVVVEGFDSSSTGSRTLTVRYNGQVAGSYMITVRRESSSSSSGGSSRRGSDKQDETRSVSLRGLPRDNSLEIGDRITLSVWPDFGNGRWDWDTDFFSGTVDEGANTLTLTAKREGRTRVTYEDNYAKTTEVLSITDEVDEPVDIPDEMPSEDLPATVVTTPDEKPPSSSLPGGAVPREDTYVEEKSSSKSSREEHSIDPVEPATVTAELEPEPAREAEESQPQTSRIPIAVAGIAAAAVMLIIGGICVWRVALKRP